MESDQRKARAAASAAAERLDGNESEATKHKLWTYEQEIKVMQTRFEQEIKEMKTRFEESCSQAAVEMQELKAIVDGVAREVAGTDREDGLGDP